MTHPMSHRAMKTSFWFQAVALCLLVSARGSSAVPSQQCIDETNELDGSATLSETMWEALHKDVKGRLKDPANGCNYTSSFAFACDIVYEGANATLPVFEKLCAASNGQIAHRTLDIKSNFLGAWTFNITMEGIPQCVGLSCDPGTLEKGELQSPVFGIFVKNMEVGDICKEKGGSWGLLDFWSDFAFTVAAYGGLDLSECFLGEGEKEKEDDSDLSSSEEEDDSDFPSSEEEGSLEGKKDNSTETNEEAGLEGKKDNSTEMDERFLRGVHKKDRNGALIGVFAGQDE